MMRILQLIDSLQTGGAEKMAVALANELVEEIGFSALVVSRLDGPLKIAIDPKVAFLLLHRQSVFDLRALRKLKQFCITHQITHVHAHGTSYFLAFLLKLIWPSIKLIWHDHNGLAKKKSTWIELLKCQLLKSFQGIIVVNTILEQYHRKRFPNIPMLTLPNFYVAPPKNNTWETSSLQGTAGKRIILVANYRPVKNQLLALEAAAKLRTEFPDWSFHLLGHPVHSGYYEQLIQMHGKLQLDDYVFFYPDGQGVDARMIQSDIGLLCSDYEGLPLSVIEYGIHGLPVVCTGVGALPQLIEKEMGFLVAPNQVNELVKALRTLMQNPDLRLSMGKAFQYKINQSYTAKNVMPQYVGWVQSNF
ncbi:MAG: hypothetical protein CFE24_14175 [Flavobacterium sp. BFFFF2]|nr:MAG: hypothetical protein CFE24_14175 [Flavobacterium sp. BFFFF2]